IIDFGGGIKSTEDVKSVFDAGASMVNVGSVTIKNPDLWNQWVVDFGADKFLPGADVLNKKIKIHGWKEETGIEVFDFIKAMMNKGIKEIFCTDISKDGMLQGPSIKLYQEILGHFPTLDLIASGGISCYDDLVVLKGIGCSGAIVGKAIYENRISLEQIKEFIKNN
ncbi:MAG: HisA/HisF-related TIM barrel protein, partial [Ginsengibacter sp.]